MSTHTYNYTRSWEAVRVWDKTYIVTHRRQVSGVVPLLLLCKSLPSMRNVLSMKVSLRVTAWLQGRVDFPGELLFTPAAFPAAEVSKHGAQTCPRRAHGLAYPVDSPGRLIHFNLN